ncbi:hypothetical protein [Algoriphagus namhaensis]
MIDLNEIKVNRSFTTLKKDAFLKSYFSDVVHPSFGSRISSEGNQFLERANWEKVYRYEDLEEQQVTYTVPLINEGLEEFSNLVIVEEDGETNSYVINYIPEKIWLETKQRRQGFGNFSGIIQLKDLAGNVFSESNYQDGVFVNSDSVNGRISGCTTEIIVTGYTTGCVDGECIISEIRYAEVEVCDNEPPGGSGGVSSGGNGSGGPGGGPGGGGPNLGNPGTPDPEDVSYWLRTLNPNDDLNNPYHGMKAIAADGTIFTYDATVNAWLMPEVVVLEDAGGILNFFNTPDFDGGIISSFATTVGQGAARTPIGRVIVGFVTINLFIFSLYEMSQIDKAVPLSVCIEKFVECQNLKGVRPWMNCDDCLQNCRTQGEWPNGWCPLN